MLSLSKLKTASQVHKELSMEAALREVKNGESLTSAAKTNDVSRTTLRSRMEKPNPSRVGDPTNDLSLRITHSSNRKKDGEWTVERCGEYISKLQDLHVGGFLERPEQVWWNFDETVFTTSEMYDRVIARKLAKQISSQFDGTEENVTILPCGNAAGVQLNFMALHAGTVHVLSRLDDTFGLCYHAVNASGYIDQVHFANYIKTELFPAVTELKQNVVFVDGHFKHMNNLPLFRYCKELYEKTAKQITKETLLCHIVKLWYRTEGCPEKYAFNGEQCLKSGFAKVGLFAFNPYVIRRITIRKSSVVESTVDQSRTSVLFELLKAHYGLMTEKDLADVKELVLLKQKGVTPGAVLANSIQKNLFGEAPKKQQREKNRQLSLSAGALITHPSFVEQLGKDEAAKNAKKVAAAAKRKAPLSQPAKQAKKTLVKKQRKA
ncbi:hypothetical protein RvY_00957 [Ramazzottius varieornatus]|uniref:DDE-1 domain-containing protein n=1 Tax=Ramazzottius varieornatus TaxID=947166 RepID=A0A1D1ULT2_RAMVA|nr:hypothetical protein RvY_00957 [Ramazzottius varieornatus]